MAAAFYCSSLKLHSLFLQNIKIFPRLFETWQSSRENNVDLIKSVRGLQSVVAGDCEVEAGLIDSCWAAVECHHGWWAEQVGIEEFKNIWMRRPNIFF